MTSTCAPVNVFQFTPLREGRLFPAFVQRQKHYFNSRPSARGDVQHRRPGAGDDLFQFTPLREGRPKFTLRTDKQTLISIHAPPRGATRRHPPSCPTYTYFNSRPSARGDWCYVPLAAINQHFNSRPSARGDEERAAAQINHEFQFTPLREGRRPPAGGRFRTSISIHAPPRGATAKDMQFLQIFCSTLTNQHGLTIVPRNLSRLFW